MYNNLYYLFLYALITLGLVSCFSPSSNNPPSPSDVHPPAPLTWKLITTWPPSFPVFHEQLLRFAKNIETMSNGRLKIEIYGGGVIVPHLQTLEAVGNGTAEMGHSVSFYWVDKVPVAQFMGAVPFGMTATGVNSWLYYGGGLPLWREMYAPYNVIPFPAGNTGVQMGGWFKKQIKTMNDFKGLKIRMPGLTGKILQRAGAVSTVLTASEINTALRRGVIEAAEWIGPAHDEALGLYREAEYYYYPGWHEPGTILELLINKTAWGKLSPDLQKIVEIAAAALNHSVNIEFEAKNIEALSRLINEQHVKLVEFPAEVLQGLKQLTKQVLDDEAKRDPFFDKVYRSYSQFQAKNAQWYKITEHAYYHSNEPN